MEAEQTDKDEDMTKDKTDRDRQTDGDSAACRETAEFKQSDGCKKS